MRRSEKSSRKRKLPTTRSSDSSASAKSSSGEDGGSDSSVLDESQEQPQHSAKEARKPHQSGAIDAKSHTHPIRFGDGLIPDDGRDVPSSPRAPPEHIMAIFKQDIADIMDTTRTGLAALKSAVDSSRRTAMPGREARSSHKAGVNASSNTQAISPTGQTGEGDGKLFGPSTAAARATDRPGVLRIRGGGGQKPGATSPLKQEAATRDASPPGVDRASAAGTPCAADTSKAPHHRPAEPEAPSPSTGTVAPGENQAESSVAVRTTNGDKLNDGPKRKKRGADEATIMPEGEAEVPAPPPKKAAIPRSVSGSD